MEKSISMENNDHPILAGFSAVLSVCSGIFAMITFKEVQFFMTFIATGVGALSAFFAIRHYYYTTRKTIIETKILQEQQKKKDNP